MSVGSDLNNSESITVEDMFLLVTWNYTWRTEKLNFFLETEHREGFLDEPKWILYLYE